MVGFFNFNSTMEKNNKKKKKRENLIRYHTLYQQLRLHPL